VKYRLFHGVQAVLSQLGREVPILNEVYGASLEDVTWVEEEGVRELTWEEVVNDR